MGVPSQRETNRKSGSPDQTAPSTPPPDVAERSKPLSGPTKSENLPKSRQESTANGFAVRPKTGIAKGTRGGQPESKYRAGAAGFPRPPKFSAKYIGILRTTAAGKRRQMAHGRQQSAPSKSGTGPSNSANQRHPRVERTTAR
jgi:hypothetical protein